MARTNKMPRMPNQLIGMRGVYSAAAELARRGFIVSPTSRSAFGADLLVTDQKCRRTWSVQVKTTGRRPASFCLVGRYAKKVASASHIYIFVSYKEDKPHFLVVEELPEAMNFFSGCAGAMKRLPKVRSTQANSDL
jgi:hypothetical protein